MNGISLPEALVLIDLDDHSGVPLAGDRPVFELLLAASFWAELVNAGRIRTLEDGRISLKAGRPPLGLEQVEVCVGARARSVQDALLGIVELDLRHQVHSHLVGMGALKVEKHKVGWFRSTWRWTTANPQIEADLLAHLRNHVATAGEVGPEDTLLLLLALGDLLHAVFDPVPVEAIKVRTRLAPLRAVLKPMVQERKPAVRLHHN